MDEYGSWFDGNDWNMYNDNSSSDWNMNDWWSNTGGNTDSGDWAHDLGGGSYGDDAPDMSGSGGSGSGFNWSGLIGPGMSGLGQYLNMMARGRMSKEQLELMHKLEREDYAAKLAEDEKYYQSHGKQLSDAYQKYKGYYVNPNDPANSMHRETNIFGLLTPKPTTGALANGW